jgi:DNA-3-methyladenine glycosylase
VELAIGPQLEPGFFRRPVELIAPDLLGCVLERRTTTETILLKITEVEAYAGSRDPASHAFRGKTPRTAVMFGPPGRAYVYFIYGMHYALNLVCGDEGLASAVLIRAGEVVGSGNHNLARGPGRLARVLSIDLTLNGTDLCAPESSLLIYRGERVPQSSISSGPRVGVNGAAEQPWRFWIAGNPTVSAYRAHRPRARGPA